MSMLIVDGAAVPEPSEFSWGLSDISDDDAGRVKGEGNLMYKNRTSQKRTLSLGWNGTDPAVTAQILQAFNPEYITVTYPDALTGTDRTAVFYSGDKSAAMKQWYIGGKRYSKVSFKIIER